MNARDTPTGAVFRHYIRASIDGGYMPKKPLEGESLDETKFVRRLVLDRRVPDRYLMALVRMAFAAEEYRECAGKGSPPRRWKLRGWLYGTAIRWFQDTQPIEPLIDAEAIRIVSELTGYSAATIRRALQQIPYI